MQTVASVLVYPPPPDVPPGASLLRYICTSLLVFLYCHTTILLLARHCVARRPAVAVTAAQVRPALPVLTAASLFLARGRPLAVWLVEHDLGPCLGTRAVAAATSSVFLVTMR